MSKQGIKAHKHDKDSKNKVFRHILVQEGYTNNTKIIKHAKKVIKYARKTIKHAKKAIKSNKELKIKCV